MPRIVDPKLKKAHDDARKKQAESVLKDIVDNGKSVRQVAAARNLSTQRVYQIINAYKDSQK